MTFQSRALLVALIFIWIILLAAVWVFPTILSIYGVLWILLPCQLIFVGFRSGARYQGVCQKVVTILISGVCEVIAALAIGLSLNTLRGWNIYFPLFDYLLIGFIASSVGLFISFLTRRSGTEYNQM